MSDIERLIEDILELQRQIELKKKLIRKLQNKAIQSWINKHQLKTENYHSVNIKTKK